MECESAASVRCCMSVFLLPVKRTDTTLECSEWKKVSGDDSVWKHRRASEYFDASVLSAVEKDLAAPEVVIRYSGNDCGNGWRVQPGLTVFKTGFQVLSLTCTPEDSNAQPSFDQLLNFNERFRYRQLMQFQKGEDEAPKYEYTVEWQNRPDAPSTERMDHTGELLEKLLGKIGEDWTPCLGGFQKLICCTAVLADGVCDKDRFRLATVDSAGTFLPHESYWRDYKGVARYHRWEPAQFMAFTNYSFCWLLDSSVPGWLGQDAFEEHLPMLYAGVMGQTLVHQIGALTVLSGELADKATDLRPRDFESIRALRKQVLEFTNQAWFDRITFEVQGHEMYCAWREAIEAPRLFEEVQRELRESDDFISAEQDARLNKGLSSLQRWVSAFAGGGLALALMPGAYGQPLFEIWWANSLVALGAMGLLGGLGYWIGLKCTKSR